MSQQLVRCPYCKKPVDLDAPEFPFCSERCKLIDLGKWTNESYRIPSTPISENEEEDESQ